MSEQIIKNAPQTFLEKYHDLIRNTIEQNTKKIHYSNAPVGNNIGHLYYINSKDVHISTVKVTDPAHKKPIKYMMNIEIKTADEKITHKCSGTYAQNIHNDLYERYKEAMSHTRLQHNFKNPSFANSRKIRGS
jgi:ribosomal protein S17E